MLKWDVAKNISPLCERRELWDRGVQQHTGEAGFQMWPCIQLRIVSSFHNVMTSHLTIYPETEEGF